jgi:hypothetical protein
MKVLIQMLYLLHQRFMVYIIIFLCQL